MGVAAILVMWPKMFVNLHMKFTTDDLVVSEKIIFF